MDLLTGLLIYLLLSYFIMGLVVIFNPELFDRFESHEKVWGWVLSPPILTTCVLFEILYGVIWLFKGKWKE